MSPPPDPIRRRSLALLGLALGAGLLGRTGRARAANVDAQQPGVEIDADGVYANCTVVFALPRALEDALHRGIPLYFLTQLSVVKARLWWFDQKAGEAQALVRLSYQPLLESYRVSIGTQQKNYAGLDEALNQVQHVLHLKVADAKNLVPGQAYQIQGTFALDLSQLPQPFQIDVGNRSDWQLEADFPPAGFTWKPQPSAASPG
jgi:hypothetical protein